MNLDKKLELANEMALAIQKTKLIHDMELVSDMAWKYADAMEAKYNECKTTGLPEALQDEFQVDWSVAPDWANWWMVDFKGCAFWDDGVENGNLIKAPSFNYQGDWKDSLRKRP